MIGFPFVCLEIYKYSPATMEACRPSIAEFDCADAVFSDASSWEAHVRECSLSMQGPVCVLDINDVNVADFCQGEFLLLEDDLNTVLPAKVASQVLEAWVQYGLKDAYHVRREMVNFKKVCLNVYQDGDKLEKDMRQLCSYFHVSDAVVSETGDYHTLTQRYTEICQTMNKTKGALMVVSDIRKFTKALCCVPRFPGKGLPSALVGIPQCMKSWRDLQKAREFLHNGVKGWRKLPRENNENEQVVAKAPSSDDKSSLTDQADESKHPAECAEQMEQQQQPEGEEEGGKVPEKPPAAPERSNTPFLKLAEEMERWGFPDHVVHFLKLVLISRGAAKALWIVEEAKILHKGLELVDLDLRETLAELKRLPGSQPVIQELKECGTAKEAEAIRRQKREELMEALFGQRFLALMTGAGALLSDACHWIGTIANSTTASPRLFLAGDVDRHHGATMFTPEGFKMIQVFEMFRAIRDKYNAEMDSSMKSEGWPPPEGSFRSRILAGDSKCRICTASYSPLWVHRGVCRICEEAECDAGRCPHRQACSPASFCPHLRACLSCTGGSCEECGFLYGDGEDVQCLVERLKPAAIYLDFDRTLCTTKGGGSPLVGNHSLDPGLASVLSVYADRAVVVTRNSFRDDIKKFMHEKGMGDVSICTTKKHQSKADAMLEPENLAPGECIVFVDDSIAELIDSRLTSKYEPGQLQRVLFSRARL